MKEIGFCKLEKQYGMNPVINCWLSTNTKLLPIKIICEQFSKERRVNRRFYPRHIFFFAVFYQISAKLTRKLVKLYLEDNFFQ